MITIAADDSVTSGALCGQSNLGLSKFRKGLGPTSPWEGKWLRLLKWQQTRHV